MVIYYIVRVITITFIKIFFPYRFINKENVPNKPCVIVANHLSNADAFIIGKLFKGKMYVLAKKESFKHKPIAWFLKTLGAIPIDRDKPDPSAMLSCFRLLKEGYPVLIFPEGTRNKTGADLLPFKSGASLFAIKAKVEVLPVFIDRKSRFLRINHIKVGKPFDFSQFYGQKLNDEILIEADRIIKERLLQTKDIPLKTNKKKVK